MNKTERQAHEILEKLERDLAQSAKVSLTTFQTFIQKRSLHIFSLSYSEFLHALHRWQWQQFWLKIAGLIALCLLGVAAWFVMGVPMFLPSLPTPIPTLTSTSTPPFTPTVSSTASPTPLFTPTLPSPTATPSPSGTPISTATSIPTLTPAPPETPTTAPTASPTVADTPTATTTSSPTKTPTTAPTATNTSTKTPTPTLTATPTLMPTETPLPTSTPLPPLGGKIAVPVFENGLYNLYLAQAQTNWQPALLFDRASQPAFTRDGRGLVLRSWNHKDWGLSLIYLPDFTDVIHFRKMTNFVEDAHPGLSANNTIVFHTRRDNRAKPPIIIKMGTNEGAERTESSQERLGEGEGPDWLGNRLVFYTAFPQSGLYLMETNGSNPTLIFPTSQKVVPSASPDGDRIAFALPGNGRWQIFTISAGQGEASLRQLTTTTDADNYLPAWSPDGQYLAFVSNRANNWAVWVMSATGANQRKLFDLPGSIDGQISAPDIEPSLSFGWFEERLSWAP